MRIAKLISAAAVCAPVSDNVPQIEQLARGDWVNTIDGNLELIDDAEAAWVSRAVLLA